MLKRWIGYLALIILFLQTSLSKADPPEVEDRNAIVTVETDIPVYLNDKLANTVSPAKVSLREWRQLATSSLVWSADYASKFVLSLATWLISKKSAANFFKVPGYIEANGQLTYLSRDLCKLLQYYITDANRYYALEEGTHIEKVYLKNIIFISDATENSASTIKNILINFESSNGKITSFDLTEKDYTHLKPFNYYLLRYLDKSPLVFQPNDLNNDAIAVFLMGQENDSTTYWVGILGEYFELLLNSHIKELTLYQVQTSELALFTEKKAADYRPILLNTHVLYPNPKVYTSMQELLHSKPQKTIQLRNQSLEIYSAYDSLEDHFARNFYTRHNRFYMKTCVSDFLLEMKQSLENMQLGN